MKKLISAILITAMTFSLFGCEEQFPEEPSAETTAPTAVTTEEITATAPPVTTRPTEPKPEPEEEPDSSENEYVEVSEGNEFIDFEYIKDYKGITDREQVKELAEAAENALSKTEEFKENIEYIKEAYPQQYEERIKQNGKISPIFLQAFVEDFDGNGKKEAFVTVSPWSDYLQDVQHDYVIFVDENKNAELMTAFFGIKGVSLLNYGKKKQLVIDGTAVVGAGMHDSILGMKNGNPVVLYDFRGGFYKCGCFLNASGWQGSGDFMYFDTEALEYRAIDGKKLDVDEVFAMDKTNSIDMEKEECWEILLFSNKYYNFSFGPMDTGGTTYTYENGKFTLAEDKGIRRSDAESSMKKVKNIDIDKALAEMKKPTEPKPEPEEEPDSSESEYVEVSEGNEFIDFEYIKDYKGITDREQVKELADIAEKTVADSGEIEKAVKAVGSVYDDELSEYLKNKESKPVISEAFIEDYDGDGNKEAFVMVDGFDKEKDIVSVLVFVDSNNNAKAVEMFFGSVSINMLDYGKNKQLEIHGNGTLGANEHTAIFGVKDGKAVKLYDFRGYLEKHDCFLTAYGWQGMGSYMYFDTIALEYRNIEGERLNADDVYAMDKTGSIDLDRKEFRDVQLFGEKYYHFIMSPMDQWGTTYVYENGVFEYVEGKGIRRPQVEFSMKKVKNIDIDKALAEMKKPTELKPEPDSSESEYAEVSEGNEFIDFDYIKDYKGITDRNQVKELADKAEKFLLENKGFKPKPEYIEHYKDYFDENGNLKPVFYMAIIEDLDGDGKDEKFILMNMPSEDSFYNIRCYLLFINKNNEVELLNDYWFSPNSHKIEEISLLDYGKVKQLIVGSWGFCGVDGHFSLYGIKNSEPILHYEFRGQFIKYKCFLSGIGYQAYGSLMYFDTVENEYRIIVGEELDLDEVMAMDTTNALADIEKFREEYDVYLIGGKYYCFAYTMWPDSGMSFVYENGKFVRVDNAVRFSATYEGKKLVKNIDMNKAESEMKKPTVTKPEPEEEPDSSESEYVEVSEGNEFIDFDYIKDYKGITDREQVKELADKAEKFLLESEDYKYATKNIERYGNDVLPYLDEKGNIKPVFERAFVEDFDGDGNIEAFVVINMPMNFSIDYYDGYPHIGSMVIFIDSSGKAERLEGNFYTDNIFDFLDYGKYKQLVIESTSAPSYSDIIGVKDGKPIYHYGIRGGFIKDKCFISSHGIQCSGDLLYFDTVENEYRIIVGEELDIEEIFKLDKAGVLDKYKEYYSQWEGCAYGAYLIGKKYYCFKPKYWMGEGEVYLYENGEFVLLYDNNVNFGIRGSNISGDNKLVKNIDMNKAEAEMKKPTVTKPEPEEEPDSSESEYVEVSEGNEFIDFDYIKDYKGITDREQVKELADLAEKAVSESDNYTERIAFIKSHISVEYDKYTSKNGEPKPEFKNAFIEDFDGDEKEEAFIIVDTLFQPFDENAATIESYLVFINNNNEVEIVNYFISIYETALFDYGKTKQLFINSYGNMGATEHGAIMGLKDGKAVEIYGFRGTIEKHGCFLTSYCWQGIGDILYFDTVAGEYRAIVGEWLDMKNVLSMDKTDSLHKVRQKYENGEFINVQLIGKKYYSFSDGIKEFTFIYKDREFIPADDKGIRRSTFHYKQNLVKNIDMNKAESEMKKPTELKPEPEEEPDSSESEYVEVSEGNEFIDFEYIKDYKGITDREQVKELADLAERFLLENKGFKPKPEYIEHYKDYFDENGNLKPVFYMAIIEDLDGDGKDEKFILMNMPSEDSFYNIRCYLLFINKNNEVELLNDYWLSPDSHKIEEISLLDYGKVKQLIVGSWGFCGVDGHFSLYGIKNSEPILHYEFRGQFIKYKCFLSGIGYQAYGSLMYFDTVENEYRIIVGEELDLDEVMAMDTTNALADIEKFREEYDVYLIGGKYYCFVMRCMDSGMSFVYENGKFVRVDNAVRFSATYEGKKLVKNIDMNKAESEMKKPTELKPEPEEEPDSSESEYVEVSEGNEFIDFEYIKDYKGITDREQVKELADKAEKFLLESEDYKYATKNIERYGNDVLPYLDEKGNIKPVFERAFVEDFDGDGNIEAFVVINMPMNFSIDYYDGYPHIGSMVIFIDSSGKAERLEGNFYTDNIFDFLDYGKYKQLVIESTSAPSYSDIIGVKDGKPIYHYGIRGGFIKDKCFISSHGIQCSGDLLYFDTVENEYRIIVGEELDIEEIFKLDKAGVLDKYKEYYSQWEGCAYGAYLIGKKYYCFKPKYWMGEGEVYLYENGEFVLLYDNNVNFGIRGSNISGDNKLVKNIDMNKAEAEMKKLH